MKPILEVPWVTRRAMLVLLASVDAGIASAQPAAGRLAWPPMGTEVVIERTASGSYGAAGGTFGGAVGRITWKFERREWNGRPVVAAVSAEDKTSLFDMDSGATVAVLDSKGKLIWTFEPPLKSGDWPLEVGKAWTLDSRMTEESFMSKPVVPWRRTVRVEAYEEVTVPAGTFLAFKVVSTSSAGWTTQHWLVPSFGLFSYFAVKGIEDRPPSNLLGAGHREWVLVARTLPTR